MQFDFIRLLPADLPLIRTWLLQPHVAQWFGDPDEWMEEIPGNLESDWVWQFRADLAGIPTGFVQCYDTARAPRGAWSGQRSGTLGLDFCIGRAEALGLGHGTRLLREFVAYVTARWRPRRLITDPDPKNERSVRVVAACGFHRDAATGLFIKDVQMEPICLLEYPSPHSERDPR